MYDCYKQLTEGFLLPKFTFLFKLLYVHLGCVHGSNLPKFARWEYNVHIMGLAERQAEIQQEFQIKAEEAQAQE